VPSRQERRCRRHPRRPMFPLLRRAPPDCRHAMPQRWRCRRTRHCRC
jgi:hypothetical protein